jgi:hypothetical protein
LRSSWDRCFSRVARCCTLPSTPGVEPKLPGGLLLPHFFLASCATHTPVDAQMLIVLGCRHVCCGGHCLERLLWHVVATLSFQTPHVTGNPGNPLKQAGGSLPKADAAVTHLRREAATTRHHGPSAAHETWGFMACCCSLVRLTHVVVQQQAINASMLALLPVALHGPVNTLFGCLFGSLAQFGLTVSAGRGS